MKNTQSHSTPYTSNKKEPKSQAAITERDIMELVKIKDREQKGRDYGILHQIFMEGW